MEACLSACPRDSRRWVGPEPHRTARGARAGGSLLIERQGSYFACLSFALLIIPFCRISPKCRFMKDREREPPGPWAVAGCAVAWAWHRRRGSLPAGEGCRSGHGGGCRQPDAEQSGSRPGTGWLRRGNLSGFPFLCHAHLTCYFITIFN